MWSTNTSSSKPITQQQQLIKAAEQQHSKKTSVPHKNISGTVLTHAAFTHAGIDDAFTVITVFWKPLQMMVVQDEEGKGGRSDD